MQLNLIIAEWNANGITNHVNELQTFLIYNYIDILLVSETHLTNKSHISLRGFDIITANQLNNRAHAGAAIVIKNTIKYEVAEPIMESYLQAAGVKITCDNSSVSIYSVYFPPRYTVSCELYDNLFNKLGSKYIIGGDFNAKHPWWGSRLTNPKGKQLFKCMTKNQFSTLSTGSPTYWPSDPAKIPDLLDFFIYKGIPTSALDIKPCDELSSDHSPIILNYSTVLRKRNNYPHLFSSKTDINVFKYLIDSNINLNIPIKNGFELEDAVETFIKLIREAACESTPTDNNNSDNSNIKLTIEIKKLIKRKRRLRKIWQTTRHPADKSNFNRAVNYLTKRLQELKNDSVGRYLKNLKS